MKLGGLAGHARNLPAGAAAGKPASSALPRGNNRGIDRRYTKLS